MMVHTEKETYRRNTINVRKENYIVNLVGKIKMSFLI